MSFRCGPFVFLVSPITWQVDRKCHLISASSFDKLCADMKIEVAARRHVGRPLRARLARARRRPVRRQQPPARAHLDACSYTIAAPRGECGREAVGGERAVHSRPRGTHRAPPRSMRRAGGLSLSLNRHGKNGTGHRRGRMDSGSLVVGREHADIW